MAPRIELSIPTFNEFAALLEKQGVHVNQRGELFLAKDTALVPPIDYRTATIRKDCIAIAANLFKSGGCEPKVEEFLKYANTLYDYVVLGIMPQSKNW